MDEKQPWFLPKNSIRALLAASLVGSTIYMGISKGSVPEVIGVLTGMAVTWYFKTREEK